MKHGIACWYNGECVHRVAYRERPTFNDIKGLTIELLEDKEFGLTEIVPFFDFREMTEKEVDQMIEDIENGTEVKDGVDMLDMKFTYEPLTTKYRVLEKSPKTYQKQGNDKKTYALMASECPHCGSEKEWCTTGLYPGAIECDVCKELFTIA